MSQDLSESLSDNDLLARIGRGDIEAFQTFHQRHVAKVTATARQLARDSQLAEDIAQEVFTGVWMRARTFDPARGEATGWLYTLVRNRMIDHWRRSDRGAGVTLADEPRQPDRRDASRAVLQMTLRQALAQVPEDQRQAVEMAYFGGLTYEETAGCLSLPVGTLKSRIRLALRTMRSVLMEEARA
jgi:RNA polymerase sigma-70 factor (ECF subfamily)